MSRIRNFASGITKPTSRAIGRVVGAVLPASMISDAKYSPAKLAKAAVSVLTAAGWFAVALVVLWWPLGSALRWVEFAIAGAVALLILLFALPFLIGGQNYAIHYEPETTADIRLTAGESFETTVIIEDSSSKL